MTTKIWEASDAICNLAEEIQQASSLLSILADSEMFVSCGESLCFLSNSLNRISSELDASYQQIMNEIQPANETD